MTQPSPKQPSNLMKAANDAANKMSSWSPAKQKFADKVAAAASVQKQAGQSQSSPAAPGAHKK